MSDAGNPTSGTEWPRARRNLDILASSCHGVWVSWCRGVMVLGYFDASAATLGARVTDVPAFRYLMSILGAKMAIIWCHWHRINVAKV